MARLPAASYDALVSAIDVTVGPCSCGVLFRRVGVRCVTCCRKDELLADLLGSESIAGKVTPGGKATVELWSAWRHAPATFRTLEPIR